MSSNVQTEFIFTHSSVNDLYFFSPGMIIWLDCWQKWWMNVQIMSWTSLRTWALRWSRAFVQISRDLCQRFQTRPVLRSSLSIIGCCSVMQKTRRKSWYVSAFTSGSHSQITWPMLVLLLQVESPLPNLNEVNFYMEQAGVGLGRMEMQRIFLALKQLAQSEQLPRCRLWGKILGRESNYIVAEATYREGEEDEEQRSEGTTEEEEQKAEHQHNEDEVRLHRSVRGSLLVDRNTELMFLAEDESSQFTLQPQSTLVLQKTIFVGKSVSLSSI